MESGGRIIDLENDDLDGGFGCELDEGEQDLEDEAKTMLSSWDRNQLIKEASEELERIKRDKENKEANYYNGEEAFDDLLHKMDPLDENTNEIYVKLIESNPTGKQIMATSTILFDRSGYLEYEPTPFDCSIYDGKPSKLDLVEGPIIVGMLKALLTLREGERANILIKSDQAYGPLGSPPLIPGDATLLYHVKIYKVWDESTLKSVIEFERTRFTEIPIEDKLKLVEEHKEVANNYLKDGMAREAVIRYKAAIKCLDELPPQYFERSQKYSESMVKLLQNTAIAFNKLGMHKAASKAAKRALFMDPTNLKAYYQLTKARIGLDDRAGAQKWIEKAMRISPDDTSFDHLRLQLESIYRNEKVKSDEILRKMARAYK